nr:APC membrane recruitment protein 1-like [Quercus suber]
METPSSIRRVTRSQALAVSKNDNNIPISRKMDDSSEKVLSKSRQRSVKQQQDRSALIDITNDSPIVGLAMGSLETPSSDITKQRSSRAKNNNTPGSGEALLRGQVKTLLQRVEEEAELSKLSLESRPFLQAFVNSPSGLLAPTPANTPHISNLSADNNSGLVSTLPSPIVEEQLISQVIGNIFDGKKQESLESEKSLLTRSLLLDFTEKSESPDSSECSSVVTYQGVGGGSDLKEKSATDDDDASLWSIQVNASSTHDEDEEEVIEEEEEYEDYYDEDDEEIEGVEEDGGLVDDLCEGISNIFVNEKRAAPKFAGKHTRYVYNSDDELVGEEVERAQQSEDVAGGVSPSIVRMKGLPTPKGKHVRFPLEEEDN